MHYLQAADRLWGRLLWLLMAVTSVYIGLIMVAIVYQTVFRSMGWEYTPLAFTFIEYGFVYMLFLGSPWLVRNRGHIYIEILTAVLGPRTRTILSRVIVLFCAIICFVWAWYSYKLFAEQWNDPMAFDELSARFDIRTWIGTVAFPIGFLLMGIEFARFLFTKDPMHAGIAGVASDRSELEEYQRNLEAER